MSSSAGSTAPPSHAQSILSATLVGVDALAVFVEVDLAGGLPSFSTVGLAEASVREARVRVQAAIANSGFAFPAGRITVNLAPAHLRKHGTGFDLPIALGVLAAEGVLPPGCLAKTLVLAELSLNGQLRPVVGALAAAEVAKAKGCTRVIMAPGNGPEAALVDDITVYVARTFADLVAFLRDGDERGTKIATAAPAANVSRDMPDLTDVRGQPFARRALEVAAAGGHNALFIGGPGAGKTMLARRLSSILPPLSHQEALEVTRVHSVAGLNLGGGLITTRPFRAPHHSTTPAGLCGGGPAIPRPGELSLAHRGVLFLDELPEFQRATLEVLRQPLESGAVTLSRAAATVRYPARSQVVAAMNPCPCGYANVPQRRCRCSPHDIHRYRSRVSGPLLDRIDLHVEVPPVDLVALQDAKPGEASGVVRERVLAARALQQQRHACEPEGERLNATLRPKTLAKFAALDGDGKRLLARSVEVLGLSARAHDRILRIARTIADLDGKEAVASGHLAEAIQYRSLDRSHQASAA